MLDIFRFFFKAVMAISIFFSSILNPAVILPESEDLDFTYLEYPQGAALTLEEAGLTEAELKSRADDAELYEAAKGYDDVNGLVVSPYYTASIGETQIPVYAATVYLGETNKGELHSFSEVYFEKDADFTFNIQLTSTGFKIKNAIVLPESLGTGAVCKNGVMTASITDFGIYTFLFNNAGQQAAYTLFVREKTDEDAEIAQLRAQYGETAVTVVENGVHYLDYANATQDNTIYYLRQGAYLIANHKYDIASEADEALYDEGATKDNTIGLTRYPFVNFYACENLKVIGNGVLDLSHLDRRERRGIVFTDCNNIEVRGVKIVNAPEWAFITYNCENVVIEDVDIFGYRQNADAFAICNSRNVVVNNCFARTGDDLFDVKALGGVETAVSDNITFTNCIAWGGKARCFGICGEVYKDISNVTFKDCAVIVRDATWDNDRVSSLAIIVEDGGGSIKNITFENIEIFRDDGRAIGCLIYGDDVENFSIENVVYKNISYVSCQPNKFTSNGSDTNSISATLENVRFGDSVVDKNSFGKFVYDECADLMFK